MAETRSDAVTAALDVHAQSIRLAAIRDDEILDERTLPYDHEAVERALDRWPGVRVCYEAGPTGYGLARHLRSKAIDCEVIAPGLVPKMAGDRVKTDGRDARKLDDRFLLAHGVLRGALPPLPTAREQTKGAEGRRC